MDDTSDYAFRCKEKKNRWQNAESLLLTVIVLLDEHKACLVILLMKDSHTIGYGAPINKQ